jgi:hypothetical protein
MHASLLGRVHVYDATPAPWARWLVIGAVNALPSLGDARLRARSRTTKVAMSMARFTCFCALALALGGAPACSDDASGTTQQNLPEDVSARVGEKGGTLKAKGVTLEIPAGALDKDVKISVTNAGQSAPKELRAEQLSDVYEFGPAGTTFNKDVEVTFHAKTDDPKAAVYFTKADGSGFEKIDSEKSGEEFTARVKHFSQGFVGVPLDDELDAAAGPDAEAEEAGEPVDELDAGPDPQLDAEQADTGTDPAPDADQAPVDAAGFDAEAEAGAIPTTHIVVHSRDRFGALVNQTWAAFQDGQGAWEALPAPGAAGVYEFDVTSANFGVAFVCSTLDFVNSWNTLTYASSITPTLDVVTQGPPCTTGAAPAKYTLQGTLTHGTTDTGWRVGHAHQGGAAVNFSGGPTTTVLVGDMFHNEPNDVMFASGASSGSYAISRFLVRRDVSLTANATGYNFDMLKDGVAPLGSALAQVLNANDATYLDVYYVTRGTGIGLWINTTTTTGSATRQASFATLPETSIRRPTDRYLLVGADQTAAQWRIASLATYATGNLNVGLPPPFTTGFSALAAPYLRPVFSFTPVSGASVYMFNQNYSPVRSSDHNFAIVVRPAWLGGSASATLTFPDFSQVPGFDARWVAPSAGSVVAKAAVLKSTSDSFGDFKSESGQSATVSAP